MSVGDGIYKMADFDFAFCLDFCYDLETNRDYCDEDLRFHGCDVPYSGTNRSCFDVDFAFDSCHVVVVVSACPDLRPADSKT